MTPEQLRRVEQLFEQAVELPAEQRSAFLASACPDDEEVRHEVEALLAADASPATLTQLQNRLANAKIAGGVQDHHLGARIGPYKLIQKLGEGGMGVVYLAEQAGPIRRRVALKVVKLGMDTRQVVARFEAERQALAMMDHPNVARVYDAGSTDTGQPYFALEYVPGIPITAYCDKHRLSTAERLDLFIQVCQAIQHAHQKGIIHRDIKPSNVLVSVQDGRPVPKVIDFGVAKATEHRLTERTLFTEQGQLIGTPEYMSPEQAEMTALDIDTRTDVYSLGVLLYELLVGALPFDPAHLREKGFAEIQRIIREEDPLRPSTRLSSLGADSTACAERRRTDASELQRLLRGDLDWITMKALDKDRTRRYASAAELAADIARHIAHEPVFAGPPGAAYRVGKFVRRNRGLVTAIVVVLIALLVGIFGTSWGLIAARRERDAALDAKNAEARERERADRQAAAARDAEQRARNEALAATEAKERALLIQKLLVDMLASPYQDKADHDVTVRELLDRAREMLGQDLAEKPEILAEMLVTLGRSYASLGVHGNAQQAFSEALAIRRQIFGRISPEVAECLDHLAQCPSSSSSYEERLEYAREAVEIGEALWGADDERTQNSAAYLSILLTTAGQLDQSLGEGYPLLVAAVLEIDVDAFPPATAKALQKLLAAWRRGDRLEAQSVFAEWADSEAELLRSGWANGNEAKVLAHIHAHATPLLENGYSATYVGYTLYHAARWLRRRFRDDRITEPVLLEVIELYRLDGVSDLSAYASAHWWAAGCARRRGHGEEAERRFREAIRAWETISPEGNTDLIRCKLDLCRLLQDEDRLDEVITLITELAQIIPQLEAHQSDKHASVLVRLGQELERYEMTEDAEGALLAALRVQRQLYGDDFEGSEEALATLVRLLSKHKRLDEAVPFLQQLIKVRRAVYGPEDRRVAAALHDLRRTGRDTGNEKLCEQACRDLVAIQESVDHFGVDELADSLNFLAHTLSRQGKGADTEATRRRILRLWRDETPCDWSVRCYNTGDLQATDPEQWQTIIAGEAVDSFNVPVLDLMQDDNVPSRFVDPERFAVVAETTTELPGGVYKISAKSDDGARVWLDGEMIIDQWRRRGAATIAVVRQLDAGDHDLRVEYFQHVGKCWLECHLHRLEHGSVAEGASDTALSGRAAQALTALGDLLDEQSKLEDAIELFSESLEARRRVWGLDQRKFMQGVWSLVKAYVKLERRDQADALLASVAADFRNSLRAGLRSSRTSDDCATWQVVDTTCHRLFVNKEAKGTRDGSSWANATPDLNAALAGAFASGSQVREIWVAQGTYSPAEPGGARDGSFRLPPGVAIYGGFAGIEEAMAERDHSTHVTVLTGDLNCDDEPDFQNRNDNSYHVVVAHGTDRSTVLDGFLVRGGNANGRGEYHDRYGGGILVCGGSPTIRNCTITDNFSSWRGAGLFNLLGSETLVSDCTFRKNKTGSGGGGIQNRLSSPEVRSCVFEGNKADHGAGLDNLDYANPLVVDCQFRENEAVFDESSGRGGGLSSLGWCDVRVVNCVFEANTAGEHGGAIRCELGGRHRFEQCVLKGNSAGGSGGGVLSRNCDIESMDCSFDHNHAGEHGGAVVCDQGGLHRFEHCVFEGNIAGRSGGGAFTGSCSVEWEDCEFLANIASSGGGMRLNDGTNALVSGCAFYGNTAGNWGGGINGVNGSLVALNSLFSGNVAEARPGGGLFVYSEEGISQACVVNCTFVGNKSGAEGGGTWIGNASGHVANCIFWDNTDASGSGAAAQAHVTGGDFAILNSCIQNLRTLESGNIASDPLFLDPDGEDDVLGTRDDNYRLSETSPCIDRGDNDMLLSAAKDRVTLPMVDLLGQPRFENSRSTDSPGANPDPVVDLGALEFAESTSD